MTDPVNDGEGMDPGRDDDDAGHGPPPLPGGAGEREDEGGDGREPPPLPRTWAELFPPRPKPEGADYGYLSLRGQPVAATPEALLRMARSRPLPPLAWSPETAGMVPPWEVPLLLQHLRDDAARRARRELRIAWGVTALLTAACWIFAPPGLALVLTVMIGPLLGVVIGSIHRRMRQAERMTPEDVRKAFDALAAGQVEAAQPAPATRALAMALLATGLSQLLMMDASIQAGALRQDAVLSGEAWRLFTAPMLHGGVLHFWLNFMALQSLGRTVETRGAGPWVPVVFLVSALTGGLASVALPPDTASVGASGGLMGMFGFLAVMAYRRKRHLPEGYLRSLLINIAVIAGLGIVAYQFIDNAAHAGGLAAGALMGLAAVPDDGRVPRWTAGPRLRRAGAAATWILWLSAAAAIGLSLLWTFGRG